MDCSSLCALTLQRERESGVAVSLSGSLCRSARPVYGCTPARVRLPGFSERERGQRVWWRPCLCFLDPLPVTRVTHTPLMWCCICLLTHIKMTSKQTANQEAPGRKHNLKPHARVVPARQPHGNRSRRLLAALSLSGV